MGPPYAAVPSVKIPILSLGILGWAHLTNECKQETKEIICVSYEMAAIETTAIHPSMITKLRQNSLNSIMEMSTIFSARASVHLSNNKVMAIE